MALAMLFRHIAFLSSHFLALPFSEEVPGFITLFFLLKRKKERYLFKSKYRSFFDKYHSTLIKLALN